jgi:hypothetical protein
MSPSDSPDPPRIETSEGVGADYLMWTRETILALLRRVTELERRLDSHAKGVPWA